MMPFQDYIDDLSFRIDNCDERGKMYDLMNECFDAGQNLEKLIAVLPRFNGEPSEFKNYVDNGLDQTRIELSLLHRRAEEYAEELPIVE